ncbi:MAG TPA: GAF domain-containing protein, partial [Puia sp.]
MKDPLSLSTLFANFGNELAGIDDKKGLLQLIAASLAPKLTISDILVSILNEDRQTHSVYIHHCDQELMKISDHSQLSRQKFRLDDGIFNITMASPSPLVVDIASILLRPEPPRYIAKWYRPSISRMIAVRLRSHGQLLGSLFLFVEKALIGIEDLGMVQHFSYMIGPALKNILSDERMSKQRQDAEALISLSTDFVKARNKEDLFTVLDQRLHVLFEFDQSCIALVDKEKKVFRASLPGREQAGPDLFHFNGGIFEAALAADHPLVIDLDRQSPDQLPEHLEQIYGRGIKEAIMMPLRKEGESFGLLILFCKTKGWFALQHLDTIRNLCNQLSIAFTNILSHETILERESDKSLIFSLGKNITGARNKSDFFTALEGTLRTILPFDGLTITRLYAD